MARQHQTRIADHTFRAQVGKKTFDLVFKEGRLLLDGAPLSYLFTPVTEGYYALIIEGHSTSVMVASAGEGPARLIVDGSQMDVYVKDERALLIERFGFEEAEDEAEREIRAPMPGLVLKVLVEPGQEVGVGEGLVVLEAMKMENELRAAGQALVRNVHVKPGDAVGKNTLLIEFER